MQVSKCLGDHCGRGLSLDATAYVIRKGGPAGQFHDRYLSVI